MPTYEYKCVNGHHFERLQRMSEAPLDQCPECGAAAERLLSAGAGLLFKGSGFYITDYRSDSYKKAAAADSGDGGASPSGEKSGDKTSGDKTPGDKTSGAKPAAGTSDSKPSGSPSGGGPAGGGTAGKGTGGSGAGGG